MPSPRDIPTVVFLHGLGQNERSNEVLRCTVAAAGYPVWWCTYTTRHRTIAGLAQEVGDQIAADLGTSRPVMAVAHSLGAILIRHLAARFTWQQVVMLAPPNQGSRVAARLEGQALFRWAFGPAAAELAQAAAWPDPPEPFAVIAGTRSLTLGNPTSWLAQAIGVFGRGVPNDGTIAVDETFHPKMSDFARVDASHTGLLGHPFTSRLILEFFEHGRFLSRLPTDVSAIVAA